MATNEIAIMFHDVVNSKFPKSGFQTIGAYQYELEEEQFVEIIKSAVSKTKNVVYTFDDGGRSFYNVIAPVLEKYGLKGVFFITTSRIGTENFLTEDELRELDKRGHIIGSHSHTHPRDISTLSNEKIRTEWRVSKQIIERILGHEVITASIPGGAVSKRVLQEMVDAGYTEIYTSEPTSGVCKIGKSVVRGRYTISKATSKELLLRMLLNDSYRKTLHRRYAVLRVAKKLLGNNYNRIKQLFLRLKK